MRKLGMHVRAALAVVCVLAMVCGGLAPMNARAAETEYVSIDGTHLYDGDSMACGKGTATYKDGVLTLNNAEITRYEIVYFNKSGLTVNLIGSNTIIGDMQNGIYAMESLTITGDGTLLIDSDLHVTGVMLVYSKNVNIQDCKGLTIKSSGSGIVARDSINISNSTVSITSGRWVNYWGWPSSALDADSVTIKDSKVSATSDYAYGGMAQTDSIRISGDSEATFVNGFLKYSDAPVYSNVVDITPQDGSTLQVDIGDSTSGDDAHAAAGSPFESSFTIRKGEEPYSHAYVHIKCTPGVATSITTSTSAATPAPCTHSYAWEVYEQATATKDGTMRYRCKYCGEVEYQVPISAYYVFNKNTQESIKNAAANATVTVETPVFISFHEMVKDALIERPDITLLVDYQNAGQQYEMTIPAGSGDTLDQLFGDSKYAGFLYLGGAFATALR